jgi:diaminohydroxyphosphoribosylaminopyrimidine deaminase/5-amino-6-(5-phosphoribosylamino)uracil reductase
LAATLEEMMAVLHARGVRGLLVEGGPAIAGSLLAAGLVDRLAIFRAPIILGAGAVRAFDGVPPATISEAHRHRLVRRATFGEDELAVFAVGR